MLRQGPSLGRHLPDGELPEYQAAYTNLPIVEEYLRNAHETRVKRLGKRSRLQGGVGTVFPNMSIHGNRTIAVWQKYSPEPLTRMEAARILENSLRLIEALVEDDDDEADFDMPS